MTTSDEEVAAIRFMEQWLTELLSGQWPNSTRGRAILKRALRHYPTANAILRWREEAKKGETPT